jgi:hypothetical protein
MLCQCHSYLTPFVPDTFNSFPSFNSPLIPSGNGVDYPIFRQRVILRIAKLQILAVHSFKRLDN